MERKRCTKASRKDRTVMERFGLRGLLTVLGFSAVLFSGAAANAYTPKEIYQRVGPGVVLILASDDGRVGSGGTGSIIRADGLVITNAHVVINKETNRPYRRVSLFLKPGRVTGNTDHDLARRVEAKLVGYDAALDMALLRMESPPTDLIVVSLGNPEEVAIGEPVVAIGHPETGGLWTLTTGTISAEIENFNGVKGKDIFQTEASLNRGNSGGPLLDDRGMMIGVNTLISRKAADGLTITSINFALKSSVAKQWLASQGVELPYDVPLAETSKGSPGGGSAESKAQAPSDAASKSGGRAEAPASPPAGSSETATQPIPSKPAAPAQKPSGESPVPPGDSGRSSKEKEPSSQILTEKRPYNLDRLIADQMKEMEDLMEEMRKKFR